MQSFPELETSRPNRQVSLYYPLANLWEVVRFRAEELCVQVTLEKQHHQSCTPALVNRPLKTSADIMEDVSDHVKNESNTMDLI